MDHVPSATPDFVESSLRCVGEQGLKQRYDDRAGLSTSFDCDLRSGLSGGNVHNKDLPVVCSSPYIPLVDL